MNVRALEIGVGLFVVAGIAALAMLSMKVANISSLTEKDGYRISARFDNIGGLKVRSSVTMAGVRIGRVAAIDFDSDTYEAIVGMAIQPRYDKLPVDTSASIYTAGLLGEQYIGLEPGAEEEYLKAQDEITLTQSAIVFEQVIGQFLYNAAEGGGEK